jgi:hypothetical protein
MTRPYSLAFKQKMLERLTGRDAVSARQLSLETGVRQQNLSRWLQEARSLPAVVFAPARPAIVKPVTRVEPTDGFLAIPRNVAPASSDPGNWLKSEARSRSSASSIFPAPERYHKESVSQRDLCRVFP